MSFVNTILDSLGNSLVITAVGGGPHVIPFLTVYAVWPASFVFLVLYSFATQRFSRSTLFNIVICTFMLWFALFGVLYPLHETVHFHGLAETVLLRLPAGMAGAVGMVRNWMFTTFYVAAELWGDVVLSLLFWGLANEMTTIKEAPLLYPLFGIGANVGQTLSGKLLSVFSSSAAPSLSYARQLQAIMLVVLAFVPLAPAPSANGAAPVQGERMSAPAADAALAPAQKRKAKLTLREALVFLTNSPQIRCLAVMALAQGLSSNLIEITWKSYLHKLHPSPAAYSAFMGDVAMWTGIVTGTLMFASPMLFARWKWRGVAGATPAFMLWTGLPFFAGCILYALAHPGGGAGTLALRVLVLAGALLQVFAKGAKFSMFKPAEEMVYIGLDEESRTKGKAAIDVAGAQTGKSIGSVLQQVLLVASSGSLTRSLPILAIAYFGILRAWSRSVVALAKLHVCSFEAHGAAPSDGLDCGEARLRDTATHAA
ncbi:hypothetical protein WJX81_003871 [Elliptochloris bilobata]|uniref:ADP,ATP carrier protein n=1 Tax=Elliptochloris bilobata TaxID=381761 RepID=A0AAW1RTS5_9CHLO